MEASKWARVFKNMGHQCLWFAGLLDRSPQKNILAPEDFIQKSNLDLLVADNILTIPMHIPLGIALTEIIAETQIPTIAHH